MRRERLFCGRMSRFDDVVLRPATERDRDEVCNDEAARVDLDGSILIIRR